MPIISYAQNHEDVLLNRLYPEDRAGFYIDVGACHPVFHSVTKLFYERGWHGINIEPIPKLFAMLADDRTRDINLHLGLSNREGTFRFYECPTEVGSSTFSEEEAAVLRQRGHQLVEHLIPVTTLARVCEQTAGRTIDFLKIDVEGHEREVLEGGDWSRFRPRVVLVEATRPGTNVLCFEQWEPILLAADYLFAFFDGLNRYYVRAADRALIPLLAVPANVFDNFEHHKHIRAVRELQGALETENLSHAKTRAELSAAQVNRDEAFAALFEVQCELAKARDAFCSLATDLETARAQLAPFRELGPIAIGVARRLRRMASDSPRVAAIAKQMLRRVHPRARSFMRDA
jgi:FkbM family methyltransferase